MLISCEKCSTTYVLDDALIPPQGAPVQCTRCGHVFTAKLAAAEAPPPPARSQTPAGSSTMMFGAPAAAAAAAPKNQTMMFGTPASNAAPAPASAPPRASPAASSAKQTMVFGTAASNAAAAPPAPAPNARTTMMFGGPPASAPAPAASPGAPARPVFSSSSTPPPAKNQTMMFGTPASNAAASAGPTPPASTPGSASKTMVFGTGANNPPPPAASSKQTMVFGTPASNAAASASPPASMAAASKQTMVFGSPVAPPAASPKNQTMVFGTAASNAAAEPPLEAEETVLDQPGQSSRTVLFGTATPAADQSPPASAAKNQTMMFGRPAIPKVTAGTVELAGYAAEEGKAESTQRVDVQEVMEDQEDQGSVADSPAEPPARHDRTQRFAMTDVGSTPSEGKNAVQDRHNRTQLFAMSTVDQTAPVGAALSEGEPTVMGDATLPPGAIAVLEQRGNRGGTDLNTTLPPDVELPADPPGVSVLHDPATAEPESSAPSSEGPVATTLPNLPQLPERMLPLAVELPPEPGGSADDLRASAALSAQQQAAEDAAAMRAVRGGGGAGKAVVIVLVLIALALAGVLAYRLFGKQLLGSKVDEEALRTTEAALATLRRDDRASQDEAMAKLQAVLAQHPNLPETQAALVIAAAFRFDDAQGRVNRTEASLRALKVAGATEEAQAALAAQLATEQAAAAPSKAQLEEHFARLSTLMAGVDPRSPAGLAMLRAEGLARSVLGDAEALFRAEAYRQRVAQRDDWVDLIEPEYALNGGSSPDEAIVKLNEVKKREANSTFLRPYVLLARLQLKKGDTVGARAELEQVSAMNSRHEIARELLASLEKP